MELDFGTSTGRTTKDFLYSVYGWMGIGLALTAGAAYGTYSYEPLFRLIFSYSWVPFLLLGAQLLLVVALSWFIQRLGLVTAAICFILYSVLNGLTLSSLFYIYVTASLGTTFMVTAGMFSLMGLYGYYSKSDLSTIGNIARMGLLGLILALLVNLWFKNPLIDLILSAVGVLIFCLLTAYDIQTIKRFAQSVDLDERDSINKVAVVGALILYLDFINMFLFLLRFTGQRRK